MCEDLMQTIINEHIICKTVIYIQKTSLKEIFNQFVKTTLKFFVCVRSVISPYPQVCPGAMTTASSAWTVDTAYIYTLSELSSERKWCLTEMCLVAELKMVSRKLNHFLSKSCLTKVPEEQAAIQFLNCCFSIFLIHKKNLLHQCCFKIIIRFVIDSSFLYTFRFF